MKYRQGPTQVPRELSVALNTPPATTPVTPNTNTENLLREWVFGGDSRKVSLYRTPLPEDLLICQVFDSATNQRSRRYLGGKSPAYERNLLQNMHPELVSSESHPARAAVFIKNDAVQLGKSYGGPRGNVEVRLLKAPNGALTWLAIDVDTNKINIWGERSSGELREKVLDGNYISQVRYNNAGFPNSISFGAKKVYEWNVGDQQVSIIRSRASLRFKVLDSRGRATGAPIPIGLGTTVESVISQVKKSIPIIRVDGSLNFARKTRFQSELSDSNTDFVDENNWGVRIVDTGNSECATIGDLGRISAAGGHAVILIEGVNENGYFMKFADLLVHRETDKPFVRMQEITTKFLSGWKNKIQTVSTNTWFKPKVDVKRMLGVIKAEKDLQGARGGELQDYL